MALDAHSRPLRRDAERNRARILEAARGAFAERGLHVPMEEIARRAGVGVGTLYRRFPSREELVEALLEERMEVIARAAEEASRDPSPWHGLKDFLEQTLAAQTADRALKEILATTGHDCERLSRIRERLTPLIDELLERAVVRGEVRADLRATDLALINFMLAGVLDYTAEVAPEAWRRMLAIVLDGLAVARATPSELPVEALSVEALQAAMTGWRPAR